MRGVTIALLLAVCAWLLGALARLEVERDAARLDLQWHQVFEHARVTSVTLTTPDNRGYIVTCSLCDPGEQSTGVTICDNTFAMVP
jgi:hypothetical protein